MIEPYDGLPAVVMPINDPKGLTLPSLKEATPILQTVFERGYLTLTGNTRRAQPEFSEWLENNPFFQILDQDSDRPAGDHFRELYTWAAGAAPPGQVLHLCYLDRVAFALLSGFRDQFLSDVKAAVHGRTPLLFHRSPAAWETHPNNYRILEQLVTRAGEVCFGKTVDFAWCHLAVQAARLGEIMPETHLHNISMVAEMALLLIDDVRTQDVDWLAWEDPFILGRDAASLKLEREASQQENVKRLAYVIPMLQLFYEQGNHSIL